MCKNACICYCIIQFLFEKYLTLEYYTARQTDGLRFLQLSNGRNALSWRFSCLYAFCVIVKLYNLQNSKNEVRKNK